MLTDDPYAQPQHQYGGWHQTPAPVPNALSQEDQQRQDEAMDSIMRWASDQIVEIFPAASRIQHVSQQQQNVSSHMANVDSSLASLQSQNGSQAMTGSQHQDILLSMIPGDKSKRSIRIYPASRPGTTETDASHAKTRFNGSTRSTKSTEDLFVKLEVELPPPIKSP